MEDCERFYTLMEPVHNPPPLPFVIEDSGRWVDPGTGIEYGHVYVPGYVQQTRRGFSRYSRRARFMCYLMEYVELGEQHLHILKVFDTILANWKTTRHLLDRKYFLNIRVLLYLIPTHLGWTHNMARPLRDKHRYERQKQIFTQLLS